MSVYLTHHDAVPMVLEIWSGAAPLEPGLLREPLDLRLDPPPDRSDWIRSEIGRLLDDCAFSVSYLSDIDPNSLSDCYQCAGSGSEVVFCKACKSTGRWRCTCPNCRNEHVCATCNGAGGKPKPCWFCGGSGKKGNYDAIKATPDGKPTYGLDPSLVSVAERVLGRCVWRCVVRSGLPRWLGVSEIGAVCLMPYRGATLPMRPASPDEVNGTVLVVARSNNDRLLDQRFRIHTVKP